VAEAGGGQGAGGAGRDGQEAGFRRSGQFKHLFAVVRTDVPADASMSSKLLLAVIA
jgi:hypothetical protein